MNVKDIWDLKNMGGDWLTYAEAAVGGWGGMVPLAFWIPPYDEVFTIVGPYNLKIKLAWWETQKEICHSIIKAKDTTT
jgi:hypothetical protein